MLREELLPRWSDRNDRWNIWFHILGSSADSLCSWSKIKRHTLVMLFTQYGPSLSRTRSTTNSYSALCTKSMVFLEATMVTNRKSAVRWKLKSQRMPSESITKSATVRASEGVLAAVHVSLDREGTAELQAYLRKSKWSVSLPQSLRVCRRMLSPRWQRTDNQVYKKQL